MASTIDNTKPLDNSLITSAELRALASAAKADIEALQGSVGSGEANTASNVGAGAGLFKAKTGVDLAFKSLVAGSNITLDAVTDTITINATGGGAADTDGLPEGTTNLYFTATRAIASILTGFSAVAGVVAATDTILQAFNKVVGNIAAITRNDSSVTQTTHSLTKGDAVYFDGTNYLKAIASSGTTLGLFIVTAVADANNFTIANSGFLSGLTGLTAGQYYYVSASTAGTLTATEPSVGNYSNPLLFATSTTSGYILSMRPTLIQGTTANLLALIYNGSSSANPYSGWNDIVIDIMVKSTGTNDPVWTVFRNGIYTFALSATAMREVFGVIHIEHDYKPSGQVLFHIHWSTTGTNTGTCRWGVEYSIAKGHSQEAFPASTTTYIEAAANGTAYTHYISEMSVSLPVTSIEPDTLILIRAFRDATHANDTLTDVAHLLKMDVHYETDRQATKNRSPNFYV